jgi:hemoglobin
MEKQDIRNRDDIAFLIRSFYEKVKRNENIGYIFNDVAKINWEHHLPIMYDFWENVVFQTGSYGRNTIGVHKNLHQLTPLTREHFSVWLSLWKETVDELFSGANAELIKQRATSIATVMQISILQEGISRQDQMKNP